MANWAKNDFHSFFQAHFSEACVTQFHGEFLKPADACEAPGYELDVDYEDEEDDLGYYDDGVKRTLTDEQIAIFRHSEIQTLRRQEERALLRLKSTGSKLESAPKALEDEATIQQAKLPASFRSNKKKKRKAACRKQPEQKPDLRKRTWDVVDKGLDTLEYD